MFEASCDPCKRALPHDDRFRAPNWLGFPFNVYAHNLLSIERWWEAATTHVRGVSQRRGDMANFTARQILDTVAPSNFVLTNPEVLARTRDQGGNRHHRRAEGACGRRASSPRGRASRARVSMINKVDQGTFLLIVQRQAARARIRGITNARRRRRPHGAALAAPLPLAREKTQRVR